MAMLAALGIVTVLVLVVFGGGGSPPPSAPNPLQQSYHVGYTEVGPIVAAWPPSKVQTPFNTPEMNCEWGLELWIIQWENGTLPGYPSVAHSGAPSWWDHDSVIRGCLNYTNGK